MTISSTSRKAGPYLGNGTTDEFPFTFKVFTADDVVIVRTATDGVETTLTMGVDYTVSLNADQDAAAGGTVTTTNPPTAGQKITVTSGLANLQPVEVTNGGGFYPRVFNDAFDRLTILVQQLAEQIGRAVKVNISSSTTPDELMDDLGASVAAAPGATVTAEAASAAASVSEGVAEAAASAAAASEAAAEAAAALLPNAAAGGADRVLVTDPAGAGWLYKTAAQLLSFLGLGTANAANGVVVLDGSSRLPAVSGELLTGVGILHQAVYDTSGPHTWTMPAGTPAEAWVVVEMWGAGGGGANRSTAGNAAGGGGGAYVRFDILAGKFPGGGAEFSVGAGGAAGVGNGNGGAGGATTITMFHPAGLFVVLTANGGGGGTQAAAGVAATGGAGGAAAAGVTSFAGGVGGGVTAGNAVTAATGGLAGGGGASQNNVGAFGLGGYCILLNNDSSAAQTNGNGGYGGAATAGGAGYARVTIFG